LAGADEAPGCVLRVGDEFGSRRVVRPFPGVTAARHPGDPCVVRLSGPAQTVKAGCG
jgi:hypothetical protein